jgi:2'-5' RNA ligase
MTKAGEERPGTIRSFVALEVEEPMRSRIMDLVRDLRARIPDVRWVKEQQIHLTLRFLGDAAQPALDGVGRALRRAAATFPSEKARFAGLGVFAERGSPRVLWLGVTIAESLLALQRDCEEAAISAGFAPESRAFHPHLTLGRWRSRGRQPSLPEVDLGGSVLSRLVLYRSDLKPSGAVYTPLNVFMLGSTQP